MQQGIPSPVVLDGVSIQAAFEYTGVVKALVLRLKRQRSREVAELVARLALPRWGLESWDGVVTWAPTTSAHLRARGHDQARILADAVGRQVEVRPRQLVRRIGIVAQTGATRSARLRGPTFVARPVFTGKRYDVRPILVIDDVVTTGATLRGVSQCLSAVSVADVHCVAIAATPGRMSAR